MKDKYQAYYTQSEPIVRYMIDRLSLREDDKIFEPCGGEGVFVESILERNPRARIDIYELDPSSIAKLSRKFKCFEHVAIKQADTLLDNDLLLRASFGGEYDKIIANPPYGAWQDFEKRRALKKIFPDFYVKETYSLFLFRSIELLKENGLLVFIIPDTFLSLHRHKALRKHLLTKTRIKEIALFPSSFFPNVNFGYANLSIITLQKSNATLQNLENSFIVKSGFRNVFELKQDNTENLKQKEYKQIDIFNNPDHAFLLSDYNGISALIVQSEETIGDVADCVTGFYSGNDKAFLKVVSHEVRNGKKYATIDPGLVNWPLQDANEISEGSRGEKCFVPIVKGGNRRYLKPDNWFIEWSEKAVKHYKTDKKARFQNPRYYFKHGIAVPMVSASSITASLIEGKLFDQSIVGVFPKDTSLTYYLLAFLNSELCNRMIRAINPSANNPANYIKKIPFRRPNPAQLDQVNSLVGHILAQLRDGNGYDQKLDREVNAIFEEIFQQHKKASEAEMSIPFAERETKVWKRQRHQHQPETNIIQ